jgi:selenocysteine lyase/cysteine desulfurase
MGTQVSIRGTAVRIAPHVWNRARDIDQLFDALEELLPKLAPSKL